MSDPVVFSVQNAEGDVVWEYRPTPKQREFHECTAPNCILEGSRGTGKSFAIRMDAHLRALAVPGYTYLIIRRTFPELHKSHLKFIDAEMKLLGGTYNNTNAIAKYPNGSVGFFTHCENDDDVMKLLSSEYAAVFIDEMTTFAQEQITKIGTCARVPEGSGLTAIIRGGTNPIGIGADYVNAYYVAKDVDPADDPDYDPRDYVAIHTILSDNAHLDQEQYRKRFSGLPAHVRQAWLDGEWVVEGAYFADFHPRVQNQPWHVIPQLPRVDGNYLLDIPWIRIYRAVDWGFFPDPAVCLWIAILPSGREIIFKEKTWYRTTAKQVSDDIKTESEGMRIAETFCDPTMFSNSEATGHSVGDIFEMNGVPLTRSVNDRRAAGYAIHEHLNLVMEDGLPKVQIWQPDKWQGCTMLIKTFPMLRVDKNDKNKIAEGQDHWVIAYAYFCMSLVGPSKSPVKVNTRQWARPKTPKQFILGSESVRR